MTDPDISEFSTVSLGFLISVRSDGGKEFFGKYVVELNLCSSEVI